MGTIKDKIILLVDDEPAILQMCQSILKENGFENIVTANTALSALERMSAKPDMAVLDVMLPDMDGFMLAKTIREQNPIPILFLTSKEYDGVYRVQELDIRIKEGDIYGFLGPNGAGKSTTMKMLLGLVKPTSGTIEIMGKPFNEKNRRDILASVGSLIESPSYYGHLTGRENMEIIRRLLDLPKKNIEEAVHIVRMENQMEKKVKNYSLGMKQRLGIAMALARFPKLLILDEPTNGLDPAGIEEMRELIKMLPKQYGMTVMISSHILSEIDQMATVVGIINQGCLIFQERMSVLDMQREPQIILRTSDNNHAFQLLKKANPQRTTDGLQIGALTDEQTGAVVQCLCSNGISVYRVEEHRESLEDIFLNLTGKELTL